MLSLNLRKINLERKETAHRVEFEVDDQLRNGSGDRYTPLMVSLCGFLQGQFVRQFDRSGV